MLFRTPRAWGCSLEWADACADSDLLEKVPYTVTAEDTLVLLLRHHARITAIGNRCTHGGGP